MLSDINKDTYISLLKSLGFGEEDIKDFFKNIKNTGVTFKKDMKASILNDRNYENRKNKGRSSN